MDGIRDGIPEWDGPSGTRDGGDKACGAAIQPYLGGGGRVGWVGRRRDGMDGEWGGERAEGRHIVPCGSRYKILLLFLQSSRFRF